MTAQADGLDVVLHGSKMHVYFAAAAEQFLVLARTGPADTVSADTVSADAAIAMYLVPATTPGITASPRLSISSDTQYRVDFDHVRIPRTAQLDTADAWGTWNAVMNEAVILASAQAMGGAEYALEITAEYAKDRRQFGKALAEFQSISHYLANAKTELDGGKLLVYEAAWAHSAGHSIDKTSPYGQAFHRTRVSRPHRHGSAGVRRYRLHHRIRHPAIFSPSQATTDHVVGQGHLRS